MTNNKDVIDIDSGIELVHGKKEAAQDLLSKLVRDLPAYKKNVRKYFDENNKEDFYTQIHNLNGLMCYVSTPRLKKAAYDLETAIKLQDKAQIAKLVDQIEIEIDKVLEAYKALTLS